MSTDLVPGRPILPKIPVSDPLLEAALEDARAIGKMAREEGGFLPLLFYKKKVYTDSNKEVVPHGTEYLAHAADWTKCWIKFHPEGGQPTRHQIRVQDKDENGKFLQLPARQTLGDLDQTQWKPGLDGKPRDPWIYQHYLPMEDKEGKLFLFTTNSRGGFIGVTELVEAWQRHFEMTRVDAQPIIKLEDGVMRTKKYGNVDRPRFEIIGWDDKAQGVRINPELMKDEMDDQIPF